MKIEITKPPRRRCWVVLVNGVPAGEIKKYKNEAWRFDWDYDWGMSHSVREYSEMRAVAEKKVTTLNILRRLTL